MDQSGSVILQNGVKYSATGAFSNLEFASEKKLKNKVTIDLVIMVGAELVIGNILFGNFGYATLRSAFSKKKNRIFS
jgi:hypothetical protein